MSTDDQINNFRARIDAIDVELVKLISERASIAQQVGRIKQRGGADQVFYRPEREAQILRRIHEMNPGPLPDEAIGHLWQEIMSVCMALERVHSIAYLGPQGTYSHAAVLKHFGSAVTTVPQESIEDVMREVESGRCHYGVVPVENSLEGPINQTLDCLSESPLRICGEVILSVHHQLSSNAETLDGVSRVYGHAQALGQCRRWLDAHLPKAERVALSSNAVAVQRAMDESASAAIAGENAAALYGLPILRRNIEDHPQNSTRFVVLGGKIPSVSGDDLTSLMFSTPNRPGALYEVLRVFANAGISMTRIESRPMRQSSWEYLFFVDIEGHANDAVVAHAIEQIAAQTSLFKVLGSYPRAVL